MNRSVALAAKRKRPGNDPAALSSDEQAILDIILSTENSGIVIRDLKFQSKIPHPAITKAVNSLKNKLLIQEVKGISGSKVLMGASLKPSAQVSGGFWYSDGKIDTELVNSLKSLCRLHLKKNKVANLEGLHKFVKESGALKPEFQIAKEQLGELLVPMVLENEITEVKSTGLGDFFRIPVGETCYRLPTAAAKGAAKTPITGAFASIPCGMCPVIALCSPDGVISPATCVYYNKWLDMKSTNTQDPKQK